jgi:hypothetical protein
MKLKKHSGFFSTMDRRVKYGYNINLN